jgi:glycogen debranching enzyme
MFAVDAAPGDDMEIVMEVVPEVGDAPPNRRSMPQAEDELSRDYARWRRRCTRFRTSNVNLSRFLDRAILDLRMLRSGEADRAGSLDAGVPWYATLFGRDG